MVVLANLPRVGMRRSCSPPHQIKRTGYHLVSNVDST